MGTAQVQVEDYDSEDVRFNVSQKEDPAAEGG